MPKYYYIFLSPLQTILKHICRFIKVLYIITSILKGEYIDRSNFLF